MRCMIFTAGLVMVVALGGGCGGYYTMSVPDCVAPIGKEAAVVARLQRNDFFVLDVASREAAIRFSVDDSPQRAAYTDKSGYAGTTVRVPAKCGRYVVSVAHMDLEGSEVSSRGYIYVWDPSKPVLVVELQCLPYFGHPNLNFARSVLRGFASKGNIVYLTRKPIDEHDLAHAQIDFCGYPDGPVLLWRSRSWRITNSGRFGLRRMIIDRRLVSRIDTIKREFPGLRTGLCGSRLAAKALVEAGIECILVAKKPSAGYSRWYKSWAEMAKNSNW